MSELTDSKGDLVGIKKEAEAGDAIAQQQLSFRYYTGDGVEQDYEKTVYWARLSAEQGYSEAQRNLGSCYLYGHGVEQDEAKAKEWYEKAAAQGDAKAIFNIGCIFHDKASSLLNGQKPGLTPVGVYGYGPPPPEIDIFFTLACGQFERAAEMGHAKAKCMFAKYIMAGAKGDRDEGKARTLLKEAIELGCNEALEDLSALDKKVAQAKEERDALLKSRTDVVEKAIYIDFEGFAESSPILLGILHKESFRQVILDESFFEANNNGQLECSNIQSICDELVGLANREKAKLIGFTQHELTVFADYGGIDIRRLYVNAHALAKTWLQRCHPRKYKQILEMRKKSKAFAKPGFMLSDFLGYIEYDVPKSIGKQNTTKRLRDVRTQLEAKGSYDKLTPVAKAKWTKVLQHNEHDCRGMRELIKVCIDDIGVQERR